MVVLKYRFDLTDRQTIRAPEGAQTLSVQMQDGKLTMWMLVDPEKPEEDMVFNVVGTGMTVPDGGGYYVGTVQMSAAFVVHVFREVAE